MVNRGKSVAMQKSNVLKISFFAIILPLTAA